MRLFFLGLIAAALCSIVISASLSHHGRGGWLALVIGYLYFLGRRTARVKAVSVALLVVLTAVIGYSTLPDFRSLVDSTFSPNFPEYSVSGIDDGARTFTWIHEASKLVNAPLLGTGFYHRGGASGLWDTGAHNFLIQMFLETGIIGGIFVVMIFVRMWYQAGSYVAIQQRAGIPTRAALIVAIIAGMSGEYFYGSASILVLFSIFGFVGALPAARPRATKKVVWYRLARGPDRLQLRFVPLCSQKLSCCHGRYPRAPCSAFWH